MSQGRTNYLLGTDLVILAGTPIPRFREGDRVVHPAARGAGKVVEVRAGRCDVEWDAGGLTQEDCEDLIPVGPIAEGEADEEAIGDASPVAHADLIDEDDEDVDPAVVEDDYFTTEDELEGAANVAEAFAVLGADGPAAAEAAIRAGERAVALGRRGTTAAAKRAVSAGERAIAEGRRLEKAIADEGKKAKTAGGMKSPGLGKFPGLAVPTKGGPKGKGDGGAAGGGVKLPASTASTKGGPGRARFDLPSTVEEIFPTVKSKEAPQVQAPPQVQVKPAQAPQVVQQAKPVQVQAKAKPAQKPAQKPALAAKSQQIVVKKATRLLGSGVRKSPVVGVSDEAWDAFVRRMCVAEPGEVTDGNGLGMFAIKPRRLEDLGLVERVRQVRVAGEGGKERMAWVCGFRAPLTEGDFLASPDLQEAAFLTSMGLYAAGLRDGSVSDVDVPDMTLSGKLAVLHKGGPGALREWGRVERRFPSTAELYEKCNGVF